MKPIQRKQYSTAMRHLLVLTMSLLWVGMGTLWAAVPSLINYQGQATSSGGTPLSGTYTITFNVYNSTMGGSPLWIESHAGVTVTGGLFTLMLGSVTPFPANIFDDSTRFLGVTIGADPEMTPRTRFTSAPYAFRAGFADSSSGSSAWTISGSDVYRATGNVGIGTSTPTNKLEVRGNATLGSYSPSNLALNIRGPNSPADQSGFQDLRFSFDGAGSSGIRGYRGSSWDTYLQFLTNDVSQGTDAPQVRMHIGPDGNVGIGTTSPSQLLDVAGRARVGTLGIGPNTPWSDNGIFLDAGSQNSMIYWDNRSNCGFFMYQEQGGTKMYHRSTGGGSLEEWKWVSAGLGDLFSIGANIVTDRNVGIGTANPTAKLHVVGSLCVTGEKNAIVPTSQGMTKVYSEESAELWFTDYGKAQLTDGNCHIVLDPLFLETVTISDEHPMMVFLQEEDESNGLIVKTGATTFDVIEKADGNSNAQFSYRVVAKRKGYESSRLESAQTASAGGGK